MPSYGYRNRYYNRYRRNRRRRGYSSYGLGSYRYNDLYNSLRSNYSRYYSPSYYTYGPSRSRDYSYNRDYSWWLADYYREKVREREREERERKEREERLRRLNETRERERRERERREKEERERREKEERERREKEERERREREEKERREREERERREAERERREEEKERREREERERREREERERREKEERERREREERERREREERERREREEMEREAREAAERERRERERLEEERRRRREREERERREEEERLRREKEEKEKREREARERAEREARERANKRPLEVTEIDLHITENAREHHTDRYDLTQKSKDAELVIRRGQPFLMDVTFNRPYNIELHDLYLVFEIGDSPNSRAGTRARMILDEEGKKPSGYNIWHARLLKREKNTIYIEVQASCESIIGEWSLAIDTKLQGNNDKFDRYIHKEDINIILNPWCKGDTVYMPDEKLLNEYILNDKGAVFKGGSKSCYATNWFFAQFEDGILETCFQILRKGNNYKYTTALADPVKIARQLTYLINGQVLVGNWSGDYSGGEKPTHWKGTDAILEKYAQTNGEPVRFGQCWVFSAVTTTICRALGMPCKSVTCIGSAHDTDESTTIDQYFLPDEDGKLKKSSNLTSDSIWNFHVWNEVFLKRTDLHDDKFDGWQVIDSTPQEASSEDLFEGKYACGPASVGAIKNGQCSRAFDAKFIFAEVNADVTKWKKKGWKWVIWEVDRKKVGTRILSKDPDGKSLRGRNGSLTYSASLRHDVTSDYKYREGSSEERKAVLNAGLASNIYRERGYINAKPKEVEIRMRDFDKVLMGEDFTLSFDVENTTSGSVGLDYITVSISTQDYTGSVHGVYFEKEYPGMMIKANSVQTLNVQVKADMYIKHLTEQGDMEAVVIAKLKDTWDDFIHLTDNFRLGWFDIDIEGPEKVKVGEEFEVKLSFKNSMPVTLTDCKLSWEGAGFYKEENVKISDIAGKSDWAFKVTIKSKKRNPDGELIVSLDCNELPDITGKLDIAVY